MLQHLWAVRMRPAKISKLQHEILYLLDRIGPSVEIGRLAKFVTVTQHQSRIRKCLEEMQEKAWAVSDHGLRWTIANGGKSLLLEAE